MLYYHARQSHAGFISEDPSDVLVPCILPTIGEDCWLKLDVEMAEYEVLPALMEAQILPRWITMEIHHYDSRGYLMRNLLRAHGYVTKGGEDLSASHVNIAARHLQA
jgi:hypothetical protein